MSDNMKDKMRKSLAEVMGPENFAWYADNVPRLSDHAYKAPSKQIAMLALSHVLSILIVTDSPDDDTVKMRVAFCLSGMKQLLNTTNPNASTYLDVIIEDAAAAVPGLREALAEMKAERNG